MFDLHSAHLDSEIVELAVKLCLHLFCSFRNRCLHFFTFLVGIIFVKCCAHHVCTDLVIGSADVLPHLLHLLKLLEKFVGELACLEDLVRSERSDFFQLLL